LALVEHHQLTETMVIKAQTLYSVLLPHQVVEQDTLVGLMLTQAVALVVVVVHSLGTHQELVYQVKALQAVMVTLVQVAVAVVLVLSEQMLVQAVTVVTAEVEPLQVLLVHQLAMQVVVVVLVM
jgi:hypothetical protein